MSEVKITLTCTDIWSGHNKEPKGPSTHFRMKFSLCSGSQNTNLKYGRLFQQNPVCVCVAEAALFIFQIIRAMKSHEKTETRNAFLKVIFSFRIYGQENFAVIHSPWELQYVSFIIGLLKAAVITQHTRLPNDKIINENLWNEQCGKTWLWANLK